MEINSCYVPGDVVHMDILSRLPSKTLLRFKCVCKSWYHCIEDPVFAQKHRSMARREDNSLFILNINSRHGKLGAYVICDDDDNISKNKCSATLDIPIFEKPRRPYIVGSCHGIVCLTDRGTPHYEGEGITMLWNPITGEYKTLPAPLYNNYPSALNPSYISIMGFGFDVKTNQYKVVRITGCHHDEGGKMSSTPPLAEVYSLGTNSWRAKDKIPPSLLCTHFNANISTYLNGFFYWWARDANVVDVLLFFDMTDEVFQMTSLPDCYQWGIYGPDCSLSSLKGSLSLIVYDHRERFKMIDIWVMDRDVKNSCFTWVRHLYIAAHKICKPLGFWHNGEEFLLNSYGGIISLNVRSQLIRDLQADLGLSDQAIFHEVTPYTDTLVSLKS